MITIQIDKPPVVVLEKLSRLLKALRISKIVHEQIAFLLPDRQITTTLLGFAQECNQYAREIASHLRILGGAIDATDAHLPVEINTEFPDHKDFAGLDGVRDAMERCTKNREGTLEVYRDLLKVPFLDENIRQMIRYQVTGLVHSFSQLSLLRTSMS
jgi:hypothetical protein